MCYITQLKYLLVAVLAILLITISILMYRFYYGSGIIEAETCHGRTPVHCINFNPNYRENIHYYHWTNSDRSVALNLIQQRYPEISINDLQKLNDESLSIIQNSICIPIKKPSTLCHLTNPTYAKNKPYQLWTLGDRYAVIQLINFYHPNLSLSYLENI